MPTLLPYGRVVHTGPRYGTDSLIALLCGTGLPYSRDVPITPWYGQDILTVALYGRSIYLLDYCTVGTYLLVYGMAKLF